MSHHTDPLAPAVHTAHEWLAAIADHLGTEDRAFTHKAVRAWLHTVRDRIGVNASAHLSAQLPELLRGIYYEGWMPAHVPVPHDVASFVAQFARQADVTAEAAVPLAAAVTNAFAALFSPGQLDHVLAQIPVKLRMVLLGTTFGEVLADACVFAPAEDAELDDLEQQVHGLSDALAALAERVARTTARTP